MTLIINAMDSLSCMFCLYLFRREAVLCTLQLECQGKSQALQCLDTCSNTGNKAWNT